MLQVVLPALLSLALLYPMVRLNPLARMTATRARNAAERPWFQFDNEEGALLYQSMQMRRGQQVYRPLKDYPFVAGTYPPVYMLLSGMLMDMESPSFLSGRVVSASAAIGIMALILSMVLVRGRFVIGGMLGAMIFVTSYEAYCWIAYYRVDLLAVFLSLLGLSCVAVSPRDRSARYISAILFSLAFFTKQTEVVAPLAAVIYYLLTDWRTGLRYIGLLAVTFLCPLAAVTAATGGQFLVHTVYYNMNTFRAGDLAIWGRHAWLFHQWLILAAGLALLLLAAMAAMGEGCGTGRDAEAAPDTTPEQMALELGAFEAAGSDAPALEEGGVDYEAAQGHAHARRQPREIRGPGLLRDPVTILLPLSLLHFLAIGKAGSAENYLLEPVAVFALFTCDAMGRLMRPGRGAWTSAARFTGAAALAVLVTLHAMHITTPPRAYAYSTHKNAGPDDFQAAARLLKTLEHEQGPALVELGGYSVIAGGGILFQPFIMSELARQGKWDPGRFHQDLRERRFELIVANSEIREGATGDIYTTETARLIERGYQLTIADTGPGRLWNYYYYRPRKPAKLRPDIVMASGGAVD